MDPVPQPTPRLCQKHGVVRDPFGHCVICRREDEDVDEDPSGIRKAATLLVLLAVAVAGVVFYKGTRGSKPPAPEIAAVAPPVEAQPMDDLAAAKQDAIAAAQTRDVEERKAAVERHMKQVPIRVYTAKKCDLCRTATAYLDRKGYAYDAVDVDASSASREELRKLNPEDTVPTIVVGDEVIVGFGPGVVSGAIYRAAAKRVP